MPIKTTDDKETPGEGKGPLDGVISREALSAIKTKVNEVSEKISATINGKGEIEKSFVDMRIDKAVQILLADLDGADGKFDNKISKAEMKKRGVKAFSRLGTSEGSFLVGLPQLKEAIVKQVQETKGDALDVNALRKLVTDGIHVQTDKLFDKLDVDHNGKINREELTKAINAIDGMPKKAAIQSDCEGQCKPPAGTEAQVVEHGIKIDVRAGKVKQR